jgi:hypothetical protein
MVLSALGQPAPYHKRRSSLGHLLYLWGGQAQCNVVCKIGLLDSRVNRQQTGTLGSPAGFMLRGLWIIALPDAGAGTDPNGATTVTRYDAFGRLAGWICRCAPRPCWPPMAMGCNPMPSGCNNASTAVLPIRPRRTTTSLRGWEHAVQIYATSESAVSARLDATASREPLHQVAPTQAELRRLRVVAN